MDTLENPDKRIPETNPYKQGKLFRRSVSGSVRIAAPPETVWQVLTDFAAYPAWNSFTKKVLTPFRPGTPVEMEVAFRGSRIMRQKEWVNHVDAPRHFSWGMHLGHPLLLTANRHQWLETTGKGTRYRTTDLFSGLLAPLVMALYGAKMREGFIRCAENLRDHVEGIHPPAGDG